MVPKVNAKNGLDDIASNLYQVTKTHKISINILKNNLKAIGYIIVCIINFNNISY